MYYANKSFDLYSVVPMEGFKKWSEYLATDFKGYDFDPATNTLKPTTAPVLNYESLRKLLTSRDWTQE